MSWIHTMCVDTSLFYHLLSQNQQAIGSLFGGASKAISGFSTTWGQRPNLHVVWGSNVLFQDFAIPHPSRDAIYFSSPWNWMRLCGCTDKTQGECATHPRLNPKRQYDFHLSTLRSTESSSHIGHSGQQSQPRFQLTASINCKTQKGRRFQMIPVPCLPFSCPSWCQMGQSYSYQVLTKLLFEKY